MADDSEDEMKYAIEYYFQGDFKYKTILAFLEKCHSIKLSRRTLMNRLKSYGLVRRGYHVDDNVVRQYIIEELDGSGRLCDYCAIWQRLDAKHGVPGTIS